MLATGRADGLALSVVVAAALTFFLSPSLDYVRHQNSSNLLFFFLKKRTVVDYQAQCSIEFNPCG